MVPSMAQRKLSPTIGLHSYSSFHFSGMMLEEKPTGEMYRPNWVMKGTMIRKSR